MGGVVAAIASRLENGNTLRIIRVDKTINWSIKSRSMSACVIDWRWVEQIWDIFKICMTIAYCTVSSLLPRPPIPDRTGSLSPPSIWSIIHKTLLLPLVGTIEA